MTIILENRVLSKLKLSKNVNNKKCATKLIFSNEKKIIKIQIIFDVKIDFESQNFAIFNNFHASLRKT